MTKNDGKPAVSFYKAEKKPAAAANSANSDLQEQVDALTEERDKLQEFADGAERIFTPVAGDGGKDESGLEAMQRIVNERTSLKSEVKRLQDIINVGKPENERLMQERGDQDVKLADLTKERDDLQAQLHGIKTEYADFVKASDDVGKRLQDERDAAQQALTEGKVLPDKDKAIQIISSVKRVSDEMAAEIYDALTAPPAEG